MNNWPIDYHLVVLVFVVLAWIVRSVVRFVKWTARKLPSVPVAASSARQEAANVQRQFQAGPPSQSPLPSQAPLPSQTGPMPQATPTQAPPQTYPNYAARLTPQELLRRQPEAGGPAVPREATDSDFRRQEDELVAYEPIALGVSLQSPAPAPVPMKKLFGGSDDLVRAIILREALGPPLSRRQASAAPPPPAAP